MRKLKTKALPLFALMLVMGAFLLAGTAYAADGDTADLPALSVDSVWLTGDTLHITVTDGSGGSQTLELSLSDYAKPGDEYVTIQATGKDGRLSNTIQFKNPYYTETPSGGTEPDASASPAPGESVSAVPEGVQPADGTPFSPEGDATVIDDVTDADSKEFFSIETENGNVFYLIVDRARDTDNVYLLNAVTEDDLAALAQAGDGNVSAVPDAPSPSPEPSEEPPEPSPEPEPEKEGGGNMSLIFIVVAVVAVGGVGYYFKIVRPKKNGGYDEPEDFNDDTEADIEPDGEEGEDE